MNYELTQLQHSVDWFDGILGDGGVYGDLRSLVLQTGAQFQQGVEFHVLTFVA